MLISNLICSGTYNNQWMVLDYKLIHLLKQPKVSLRLFSAIHIHSRCVWSTILGSGSRVLCRMRPHSGTSRSSRGNQHPSTQSRIVLIMSKHVRKNGNNINIFKSLTTKINIGFTVPVYICVSQYQFHGTRIQFTPSLLCGTVNRVQHSIGYCHLHWGYN
jgi:hypothetical protein